MKSIEFNQGIIYAAASLVRMHDQPTMALDIINEAGLKPEDMRNCSEYDLAVLRQHDSGIPRGTEE